jgi:hypothetical protein
MRWYRRAQQCGCDDSTTHQSLLCVSQPALWRTVRGFPSSVQWHQGCLAIKGL